MKKLIIIISILLFLPTLARADLISPLDWPTVFLFPVIVLIEAAAFYAAADLIFKAKIRVFRIVALVTVANLLTSMVGTFFFPVYEESAQLMLNLTSALAITVLIELALFLPTPLKAKLKTRNLLIIVIMVNILSYMMIVTAYPSAFLREDTRTVRGNLEVIDSSCIDGNTGVIRIRNMEFRKIKTDEINVLNFTSDSPISGGVWLNQFGSEVSEIGVGEIVKYQMHCSGYCKLRFIAFQRTWGVLVQC